MDLTEQRKIEEAITLLEKKGFTIKKPKLTLLRNVKSKNSDEFAVSFLIYKIYLSFNKLTSLFHSFYSNKFIEASPYGKAAELTTEEEISAYQDLEESTEKELLEKIDAEIKNINGLLDKLSKTEENLCKNDTVDQATVKEYKKAHPGITANIILGMDSITKKIRREFENIKEDHSDYARIHSPDITSVSKRYDVFLESLNNLNSILEYFNDQNRIIDNHANKTNIDENGNYFKLNTIF